MSAAGPIWAGQPGPSYPDGDPDYLENWPAANGKPNPEDESLTLAEALERDPGNPWLAALLLHSSSTRPSSAVVLAFAVFLGLRIGGLA